MSKRGVGHAAANWSSVENYGERKIVGYADERKGVSMRGQRADVKKALCSVRKINSGGTAVALDGRRAYMQNKETGQNDKDQLRGGAARHARAVAGEGRGGEGGDGERFEGPSLRDLGHGERGDFRSAGVSAASPQARDEKVGVEEERRRAG